MAAPSTRNIVPLLPQDAGLRVPQVMMYVSAVSTMLLVIVGLL